MQLNTLLQQATKKLKSISESANLDAELLMCHVTGFARHELITQADQELTKQQQSAFQELIARRLQHEPVAYIIKSKEFYGRDFYVDKNVLIPRPETEELIDLAVEDSGQAKTVLDIACGSGCIGISLLLELSKRNQSVNVTCVDISREAIDVTKRNAARLIPENLKDQFTTEQIDILQAKLAPQYDLIVSNPPYIPSSRINSLEENVAKYEPILALDGGAEGTRFYPSLLELYKSNLNANGKMLVEIDHTHEPHLRNLLKEILPNLSEDRIEFVQDYSGKTRFLILYS